MWVLVNALCKPGLGMPSQVNKILRAENWQKVDELKQYISVITGIAKNG